MRGCEGRGALGWGQCVLRAVLCVRVPAAGRVPGVLRECEPAEGVGQAPTAWALSSCGQRGQPLAQLCPQELRPVEGEPVLGWPCPGRKPGATRRRPARPPLPAVSLPLCTSACDRLSSLQFLPII